MLRKSACPWFLAASILAGIGQGAVCAESAVRKSASPRPTESVAAVRLGTLESSTNELPPELPISEIDAEEPTFHLLPVAPVQAEISPLSVETLAQREVLPARPEARPPESSPVETGRSSYRSSLLFTGGTLTQIGFGLLGLAGVTGALALFLSRREHRAARKVRRLARQTILAEQDLVTEPVPSRRELLSQLIAGTLPIVDEVATFPRGVRLYGRPLPTARYRLDESHLVRDPHFRAQAPVATPAWERPAGLPVHALDAPHFAKGPSAWDRPAEVPEAQRR